MLCLLIILNGVFHCRESTLTRVSTSIFVVLKVFASCTHLDWLVLGIHLKAQELTAFVWKSASGRGSSIGENTSCLTYDSRNSSEEESTFEEFASFHDFTFC